MSENPSTPSRVDLDALDTHRLVTLAESLLEKLENYQRHAAAAGFRVSVSAVRDWGQCAAAALSAEAELSRLGLPARCPPTSGSCLAAWAVDDLREWLQAIRGQNEQGWGVRGWELPGKLPLWELPDQARPLGQLREIVRDLRSVGNKPTPESVGRPEAEGGEQSPPLQIDGNDEKILLYLLEMYPRLRLQPEVAAGAGASRETVRKSLERLRSAGLTNRPKGERKGDSLTQKGKELAERLKRESKP